MGYATPPNVADGDILTGHMMNRYVRNNLESFGGKWEPYTPTLAGGWVLGNGTLEGWLRRAGHLVIGRVEYTVGSTDTKAATSIQFRGLPADATPNNVNGSSIGRAGLYDVSLNNRQFRFILYGTSGVAMYLTDQADTRVDNATPWTWATGDQMLLDFLYEST